METLFGMTFGQAVKKLRESRGWTQNQLAKAADVNQSTLARVELDPNKDPYLSIAAKIAHGLGVTVDSLLAEVPPALPDDAVVLSLRSYREIKASAAALEETVQRTRRNTDRLRLVEEDVHHLTALLLLIVQGLGERVEQQLAVQASPATQTQRAGRSKQSR